MAIKAATKAAAKNPKSEGVVGYKGLFLPITGVRPDSEFNPRGAKNVFPNDNMVQSIRVHGVLKPIHVREVEGELRIIDGERRYWAAKEAKVRKIPVINHGKMADVPALILACTANTEHKTLTKGEFHASIRRLESAKLDVEKIAEVMNVDERTVTEAISVEKKGITGLKTAVLKPRKDGGVSTRDAARISRMPQNAQEDVLSEVTGKSQKESKEAIVRKESELGIKKPGPKKALPKLGRKTAATFTFAFDADKRASELEALIRKKLRASPTHKALNAQLLTLECLRGNLDPTEVFDYNNIK